MNAEYKESRKSISRLNIPAEALVSYLKLQVVFPPVKDSRLVLFPDK